MIWINSKVKVLIAYKIYRKGGTKRTELALELINYEHLKLKKIQGVVFDYSSKGMLKKVRDCGWHFYTQVKYNRLFNGVQLKHYCYDRY